MKQLLLIFALINSIIAMGQSEENMPYYEIPEYSETYTANSVSARMIDGLDFGIIGLLKGCVLKI